MRVILGFLLALLAAGPAAAQQNLGNLPPNTVVGRMGAGRSGPAQAIPFATLSSVIQTGGGLSFPTSLTVGTPLIGTAANTVGQGTRSGSTTVFGTTSGTLTNGHCVSIDSSGNLVDAGGTCTTGGGGGTVSSASQYNLAYYASAGSTVSGLTNGTAGLPLVEGSPPSWGQIGTAAISNSAVTNALLANMNADTIKCNNTGSAAAPIDCTTTQADNLLSASPWNDGSAVVGNKGTFWTNSGSALISRFNRLFVGEAALGSGGGQGNNTCSAGGTRDWLETLAGCSVSFGSISVVNQIGLAGVVAGTRTSDYQSTFSAASGNSLALVGLCYNDDTTSNGSAGNEPVCQGGYYVVIRKSGNKGISFAQQVDPHNGGTNIVTDPYTFLPAGITGGQLFTAGSLTPFALQNVTVGLAFSQSNSMAFNSGLVFYNGSIAGSGPGGIVPAIQLPTSYTIAWYTAASTLGGTISFDGSGNLLLTGGGIKINGTAAVSCSGGTVSASTLVVAAGIVVHC